MSDLVKDRKVYLSRGLAFVTVGQLASVMVGHFRSRLSKSLVVTARQWETMVGDCISPCVCTPFLLKYLIYHTIAL